MLKNWTYELSANAIDDSITSTEQPEFTDVNTLIFDYFVNKYINNNVIISVSFQAERTVGNDADDDLGNITDDVIFNLSQELQRPKKARLSRNKRN